jgi:hypothetical protein
LIWAAAAAVFFFSFPGSPRAAWPTNGLNISAANENDKSPVVAPDGQGGAVVAWTRMQSPYLYLIVAQRLNAAGTALWASGGVIVNSGPGFKRYPAIMNDGANGSIIAWEDGRSDIGCPDIYVQRLDNNGMRSWRQSGVEVCTAVCEQRSPKIVTDGSGGAIVVWSDRRGGHGYYDIYAQRVDRTGVARWTQNGVAVFTGVNLFTGEFDVVEDGAGGAVIVWPRRNWGPNEYDIVAQRLNPYGAFLWTSKGVTVCAAAKEQIAPRVARTDDGAVIVAWHDRRSGASDIYAQKISMAGTAQWGTDGVCICTMSGDQRDPCVVATGGGGAIVAWQDFRNGNQDVFYQKLAATGEPLWTTGGVALCTQLSRQSLASFEISGATGAFAVWYDERYTGISIFARRVAGDGSTPPFVDGVAVCATKLPNPNSSYEAQVVPDGAGGAFIAWEDYRGGRSKIYMRRSDGLGTQDQATIDPPVTSVVLRQNYPNPFNPTTIIGFELNKDSFVSLLVYRIDGTLTRHLLRGNVPAGEHAIVWDGKDDAGRRVASGVYLYRLETGSSSQTKKMILLR